MARHKKRVLKIHYGKNDNILCHHKSNMSTINIRDVTCKECRRKYKKYKLMLKEIINQR